MTSAAVPAAVGDGWVPVKGHQIHYLTTGSGPTVILLHGGIIDAAALSWAQTIGPLGETHRVIAPDMVGYGESDKPEVDYSTTFHIDILDGFMDALDVNATSIVGLSLGGAVALGYTLRRPDLVNKLVLVDSHGLGAPPSHPRIAYALAQAPILNRFAIAILRRSRSLVRASLNNVVLEPETIPEAAIEELYRLIRQPDAGKAFRRWRKTELTWRGYKTDFTDKFPDLAVTTLLVHGAEDEIFAVGHAERAAELLPNGTIKVIPGCGHWPPREKPDEFIGIVSSFLTD